MVYKVDRPQPKSIINKRRTKMGKLRLNLAKPLPNITKLPSGKFQVWLRDAQI